MNKITSRRNPLIVHMKKLGADGDYRRQNGEFLCDGDKLLREAISSGADITAILFSCGKPEGLPAGIPIYAVPRDIIKAVSPLKAPQDVLFSCRIPETAGAIPAFGFHVILEGLQDPGNVGTILRTAGAFNVGSIILTGGCADPFNPKAIRASMGAIFRQPIVTAEFNDIRALKNNGLRIYGAALSGDSRDVRDVTLKNAAVAIGSEGCGLSPELLDLCDEKIIIPMSPKCESLNAAVAAAIVMWEAGRNVR
ncbi:MAG: RNA methyltransferase [Clostridiales bacterium]|jgi:TrmH family RNA methyltransferase|nr:RNA methyltransferase [Clostridiales bacterium]